MRISQLSALITMTLLVSCRDPPEPPSQQMLDRTWQQSVDARQRADRAGRQLRHVERLRDIDRLRNEAEAAELRSQASVMRGLLVTLSIMLLTAMLGLAVEIRRRRILAAVVRHTLDLKGGEPRSESNESRPSSDV